MYVLKVNIYPNDAEYLIFNNEENIKEFIIDHIIYNNVDYSNLYDYKAYSLNGCIYVLCKLYNFIDIYKMYSNNIVGSYEFGDYYNIIEDFKNINKNGKYFKKILFDYKIAINLDFSEIENNTNEYKTVENNKNEYKTVENNKNN